MAEEGYYINRTYESKGSADESKSSGDEALGVRAAQKDSQLEPEQARLAWNVTQDLFNAGLVNSGYWFGYQRGSGQTLRKPGYPGRRF